MDLIHFSVHFAWTQGCEFIKLYLVDRFPIQPQLPSNRSSSCSLATSASKQRAPRLLSIHSFWEHYYVVKTLHQALTCKIYWLLQFDNADVVSEGGGAIAGVRHCPLHPDVLSWFCATLIRAAIRVGPLVVLAQTHPLPKDTHRVYIERIIVRGDNAKHFSERFVFCKCSYTFVKLWLKFDIIQPTHI
jgi:hypothetical protein